MHLSRETGYVLVWVIVRPRNETVWWHDVTDFYFCPMMRATQLEAILDVRHGAKRWWWQFMDSSDGLHDMTMLLGQWVNGEQLRCT